MGPVILGAAACLFFAFTGEVKPDSDSRFLGNLPEIPI